MLVRSLIGILFSVIASATAWSKTEVIDEVKVVRWAYDGAVNKARLDSGRDMELYGAASTERNFQAQMYANINHQDSNERPLFQFAPTVGPVDAYALGVRKNLTIGAQGKVEVFSTQTSINPLIEDATRTGFRVGLSLDLWKNFLGRIDQAKLGSASSKAQRAQIENRIQLRSLELDLRKTYWSLVGNEESLRVSRKLLELSERQLKDAEQRAREGASDAGEVARFGAQVEFRRASISSLEFQREQLLSALRSQLPQLQETEIELAPVDLVATTQKFMTCAGEISGRPQLNPEHTLYPKVLNLIRDEIGYEQKVNESIAGPDLQLKSQLDRNGLAQGFDDSYQDFSNLNRGGYQVGLELTIPLGSDDRRAEKLKKAADQNRLEAEERRIQALLLSEQKKIVQALGLLDRVWTSQKKNSELLEKNLKSMETKFRQARVSVNVLLQEQDTLFSSRIQEINTQLTLLHTLYDYFKIFTEHPCTLNHIQST